MIISNVCWRFYYGAAVIMFVMFVAVQFFCKIKCKEVCAHSVTLMDTGICFETIILFIFTPDLSWVLVSTFMIVCWVPKPSPALTSALIYLRYWRLSTCLASANGLDSLLMWWLFPPIPLLRIHILLCFHQLCMLFEKVVFQHLVYHHFISLCIRQGLFLSLIGA